MKLLGHEIESQSLITEWNILQDVFPGRFLNEGKNIRCVPLVQATQAEKDKLVNIHHIQNLGRYLYIIAYNMSGIR